MSLLPRREWLKVASLAAMGSLAVPATGVARAAAPKIKIGQIGTGHAHANKLAAYRASDDYEVVGVVESNDHRREQAKKSDLYRDLPWMTQEQLLNTPGLQAVLVETEVRDLLTAAEACIGAGKHIHLDKPAGESLPHYERVLKNAERQKLVTQMGYMFRYNPACVLLREFLKQGWLGDVFEVHAVMSKVVPPELRKSLAEYSGGIMFELGCHVIDQVVGILGPPDRVQAFPRHSSTTSERLLDNMLAVFEYPRATASVRSSALEVDGGARRHLVVCGTEGTFHIQPLDNPAARVTLSQPRGKFKRGAQDVTFPKYIRYVDDAADMARVIRGEKAFDWSYDHDLAVQRTVLQASGVSV